MEGRHNHSKEDRYRVPIVYRLQTSVIWSVSIAQINCEAPDDEEKQPSDEDTAKKECYEHADEREEREVADKPAIDRSCYNYSIK